MCKSKQISFYALGMPGYRSTQNQIPTGLDHLKIENNNILHFINLNNTDFCKETFNTQKDWLGNSHLNEYGARKLTKYLYNNYLKDYSLK